MRGQLSRRATAVGTEHETCEKVSSERHTRSIERAHRLGHLSATTTDETLPCTAQQSRRALWTNTQAGITRVRTPHPFRRSEPPYAFGSGAQAASRPRLLPRRIALVGGVGYGFRLNQCGRRA